MIKHDHSTIKELTIVSEMSLTIGLFALTVGNFLGGIWANESWGRYWSWDTERNLGIHFYHCVCICIAHEIGSRFRGRYAFHLMTMFAFCSMVMTYFGVNYYLSGLHSYAAGDPIPVPAWVYISIGVMTALGLGAYYKYKKLSLQNNIKFKPLSL